jgi:hypothetical protein
MAMNIVFQRKKRHRAKGVGFLNVLAKVKCKKMVLLRPNYINGLKQSHATKNKNLSWNFFKRCQKL